MNGLKAALRLDAMFLKAQIGRSLKMHQYCSVGSILIYFPRPRHSTL